jgi:hypothetical protein
MQDILKTVQMSYLKSTVQFKGQNDESLTVDQTCLFNTFSQAQADSNNAATVLEANVLFYEETCKQLNLSSMRAELANELSSSLADKKAHLNDVIGQLDKSESNLCISVVSVPLCLAVMY